MSAPKHPAVKINAAICTGCRACSVICALSHEGALELAGARIRIEKHLPDMDKRPIFKPIACRMCVKARCVAACPTGALVQREDNGLVVLHTMLCDGCGQCVEACPFHAIWMDERHGVAIKCDLCGGDPMCVRYCSPGALSFSYAGENESGRG